jgi:hypothetical protein
VEGILDGLEDDCCEGRVVEYSVNGISDSSFDGKEIGTTVGMDDGSPEGFVYVSAVGYKTGRFIGCNEG